MKKTIYYITGAQSSGKSFLSERLEALELEITHNSENVLKSDTKMNMAFTSQLFDWDDYHNIKKWSGENGYYFMNINLEID